MCFKFMNIFHILSPPNMNQHRVRAHIMFSSNEICANKGTDAAARLIMNTMTRWIIVIHSKQ